MNVVQLLYFSARCSFLVWRIIAGSLTSAVPRSIHSSSPTRRTFRSTKPIAPLSTVRLLSKQTSQVHIEYREPFPPMLQPVLSQLVLVMWHFLRALDTMSRPR